MKNRFQAFAFKCNLYRYSEGAGGGGARRRHGRLKYLTCFGYQPRHLRVGSTQFVNCGSKLCQLSACLLPLLRKRSKRVLSMDASLLAHRLSPLTRRLKLTDRIKTHAIALRLRSLNNLDALLFGPAERHLGRVLGITLQLVGLAERSGGELSVNVPSSRRPHFRNLDLQLGDVVGDDVKEGTNLVRVVATHAVGELGSGNGLRIEQWTLRRE